MAAPDLLNLEVLAALRKAERSGSMSAAGAEYAIANLATAPVERFPTLPLLGRSWRLRANLTVYDASYVALAELLDVAIVTSDVRLGRAPGLPVPLIQV
jgi:predicted nucleic acid-binding protein